MSEAFIDAISSSWESNVYIISLFPPTGSYAVSLFETNNSTILVLPEPSTVMPDDFRVREFNVGTTSIFELDELS